MKEFYVKVPDDKEAFFAQLCEQLNFEYERLFSTYEHHDDIDAEHFYTDSDE